MILQTNSYIVPKEKRSEHARLLARFRQSLAKLGCDHFEAYEQVGADWSGSETGRFVQIMRFRDRKHQQQVQAAERSDPAAQALIKEFCELINFPYQQQQGLFALGYYSSVLAVAPSKVPNAPDQIETPPPIVAAAEPPPPLKEVEEPEVVEAPPQVASISQPEPQPQHVKAERVAPEPEPEQIAQTDLVEIVDTIEDLHQSVGLIEPSPTIESAEDISDPPIEIASSEGNSGLLDAEDLAAIEPEPLVADGGNLEPPTEVASSDSQLLAAADLPTIEPEPDESILDFNEFAFSDEEDDAGPYDPSMRKS